jgi:hypothetical protein
LFPDPAFVDIMADEKKKKMYAEFYSGNGELTEEMVDDTLARFEELKAIFRGWKEK